MTQPVTQSIPLIQPALPPLTYASRRGLPQGSWICHASRCAPTQRICNPMQSHLRGPRGQLPGQCISKLMNTCSVACCTLWQEIQGGNWWHPKAFYVMHAACSVMPACLYVPALHYLGFGIDCPCVGRCVHASCEFQKQTCRSGMTPQH